ncbi:MBL fold metallo-hydrolase [Streptomyces sp. NP160]|uniref:MBL fold metallo-hydrolase n=1 Tax=Streptomyces sp. NP160 TaxID=2586637 RepID=UPI00214AAC55|nr:MBL fold metallo-hydrolase [Streptomyces sp. NP160]
MRPDEPATATFIGNATVLLRWGPFTLLTDPNFLHRGDLAWLGHGLVTRRLTEPALQVDQLPDLDAVLLSHLHGDHWDRVARRGLDRGLPIITTPHAARRLQGRAGFRRADGLRTGERRTLNRDGCTATVTSLPGAHATGVLARLLPPVMGSLVDFAGPDGKVRTRVYTTGDTLLVDAVRALAARLREGDGVDAALVHLGGTTLPGGAVVTLGGEDGAELVDLVRPRAVVPVHHSDYGVFRSPLGAFDAAVERRGLRHLVQHVAPGETVVLPSSA